MILEDVRQAYYDFTGKTSEIVRQLGFAGIALVWIFKTGTDGNPIIPNNLLIPAILIVISLTSDLSQYIAGSIAWGVYNRIKEKRGTSDKENFEAPRYINWATNAFFITKIICMAIAYFLYYYFPSFSFHLIIKIFTYGCMQGRKVLRKYNSKKVTTLVH